MRRDKSEAAQGAGQCHCEAAFAHLWKVTVIRRGSWWLEESKHYTPLQEGTGNYKVVSLTAIFEMMTEQILLEAISKNTKGKKVTGNSQHEFIKGKLCLTNLMGFLMRGEQCMWFTLTSARHSTLSALAVVSLQLNWWDADYVTWWKTGWTAGLKRLWSVTQCLAGNMLLGDFLRGGSWDQYCWIYLLMKLTKGLSTLLASS